MFKVETASTAVFFEDLKNNVFAVTLFECYLFECFRGDDLHARLLLARFRRKDHLLLIV